MQKRQSIAIIIALLCALIFGGNVGAQDEDKTVYFYLNVEDDQPYEDIFALYSAVKQELKQYGYKAEIVEDIKSADISMTPYLLEFSNGYEQYVLVKTHQPLQHPSSPILYSNFDIGLRFPLSYFSLNPNNGWLVVEPIAGAAFYTQLDCELVIDYFNKSNSKNPSIGSVGHLLTFIDFYLGNCALLFNDYEAAIEKFNSVIRGSQAGGGANIASQYSGINLAWAIMISGSQDYTTPFGPLDELLIWIPPFALDEERPDILSRRAQLYALAFDYDSAIADMDTAIELAEENELDNTTLAELYTLRGEIIFLIYEWDRVLDNFNHALELDPDYAPAYFQRGVLYYTMALREEALADFETYLELEPEGLYAEQAQGYIESIKIELDTLGG